MNKIKETIKGIYRENNMLVFIVEDEYYLIELLENYSKDYIHKHFDNKNDEVWIYDKDLKGNLLKEIGDIGRTWVCCHCGCEVSFDKELISKDYDCACLNCDEDLYNHETSLIPNERVNRFINDFDKLNYKKYGYI